MKRLLLALLLGVASTASAQDGLFLRDDCTVLTSPVTGRTWCFDATNKMVKVWNGAIFQSVTLDPMITSATGNITLTGGNNVISFAATASNIQDNTSLNRLHLVGGSAGIAFYNHAAATANVTILDNGEVTLVGAALSALGTPANGTVAYCSDCDPASSPCTASGAQTGSFAFRMGGAWKCI